MSLLSTSQIKQLAELNLSERDLLANFNEEKLAKALLLNAKNTVSIIEPVENLSGGSIAIKGRISDRSQFEARFIIRKGAGKSTPVSYCNCVSPQNCAHGAAVLMQYIQKQGAQANTATLQSGEQSFEAQEVFHWINQHFPTQKKALNQPFGLSTYHIVYLLNNKDPDAYGFQTKKDSIHDVIATAFKVRVLKNGGYGKSYPISAYELSNRKQHEEIICNRQDETILQLMQTLNNRHHFGKYSNSVQLQGDLGELLLDYILSSQKAYWNSIEGVPLNASEAIEYDGQWQLHDGYYEFDLSSAEHFDSLFIVDHAYYIDETHHHCGRLNSKLLNAQTLKHMLAAPSIPQRNAAQVSEQLFERSPKTAIPLPKDIGVKELLIDTESPQPRLLIETGADGLAIATAQLSFKYGDHYVPSINVGSDTDPWHVEVEGKQRMRIKRVLGRELEYLDQLTDMGLSIHAQGAENPSSSLLLSYSGHSPVEEVRFWDDFVHNTEAMQAQGWQIDKASQFKLNIELIEDDVEASIEDTGNAWFEMSMDIMIGNKKVKLLPILVNLLSDFDSSQAVIDYLETHDKPLLQYQKGRWLKIDSARILPIVETMVELFDSKSLNEDGRLEFSLHDSMRYGELLNQGNIIWKGHEEIQALYKKLNDFKGIKEVDIPKTLTADLRDYQKQGVSWLQFLREFGFNGILADDMGLGKTIQTLCHLLIEKERGNTLPSLVIAPTSLMSNWNNEVRQFAPSLTVLTLQGNERKDKFAQMAEHDIVLTTYPLIHRDFEFYKDQTFHFIVLDEAQQIKNPTSKTTQHICRLKSSHRLCLTGTPLENHLGEIWSQYHFLMPGYLYSHKQFTQQFKNPIEKQADAKRSQQLTSRLKPFLLRRTKEAVATELPEKSEIIRTVQLQGKQRDLYESVRMVMEEKIHSEINSKGFNRSHIMILDALLKLRQVCCDPRLVKLKSAASVQESAKLELLMSMLTEMIEEGRQIIIFSQFTSMLDIIASTLEDAGFSFAMLTGKTQHREKQITAFQSGEKNIFLISLKAGGVGLNLTAADTVIHYDPWWNPAVENQATDRAYRIGQDKPVFVYKMITENSVEEKILMLQQKKADLAKSLYKENQEAQQMFDENDLKNLLQPMQ